jgi:starch synthase
MAAAIFYLPEAYTTSGPKLMGRNAAGESFLRGFLEHSSASTFWTQVEHREHAQHFSDAVRLARRQCEVKSVDKSRLGDLAEPGVVYHPGPGIGSHAWQRTQFGNDAWSLCGITHTTSSASSMDSIVGLLTAPVQPWDALICTSTAVKDNVERLLQAQLDYLQDRLGVTKVVTPMTPVIPLGIHTKDFAFTATQRHAARAAVSADDSTLVVLYTGRLSFHAKSHPLAMYQALELAAADLTKKQKIILVECGWHSNEHIAKAFAKAAATYCPSVRVVNLDGRDAAARQTAWACADVFCSLSDNIQETFGIVPIEAMAAGLPVIVSDWDGYKDTIRDGIDGFRIATIQPQAGLGADLAYRHALEIDTYDFYCGHCSTLVAVDVNAAAQAFTRLFQSKELRLRMGAAGRERAQTVFDWANIIPQYESLWAQQTVTRLQQKGSLTILPKPWPARMDPFYAFAAYPTRLLTPDTLLSMVALDVDAAMMKVESQRALDMVQFASAILPSKAEVLIVLQAASHGPKSARELVTAIPAERQGEVLRSLAWLLKLNALAVSPATSP